MHTDLGNTSKNLMAAFRSSPFGSFNHAHADQNSFNILFGGAKPVQVSDEVRQAREKADGLIKKAIETGETLSKEKKGN